MSQIKLQQAGYQDIFTDEKIIFGLVSTFQPKRILITGAQGMVGNAIACSIQHMRSSGVLQYSELVLASRTWNKDYAQKYTTQLGIKCIGNSEIEEIGKIDLVIHTASPSNITHIESLSQLREVNIEFIHLLRKLNPKKFIFLSSGEVYKSENLSEGSKSTNFSDGVKRDWYPIAKLEAEDTLQKLALSGEFNAHVIRLFHTFGPGVKSDDGRSFADILWRAVTRGEIALLSKGDQIRSFLYLSDAISGIISAALHENGKFQISNLGSTAPVSILEFAQMTARITGSTIKFADGGNYLHSPNDNLVPKLGNILSCGWEPQVDLETGIRRTTTWIQNSIQKLK